MEDGPQPDSPFCTRRASNSLHFDCPNGVGISIFFQTFIHNLISNQVDLSMMDNVNKALVIDYNNSKLISCGSLFQGTCNIRSLGNISLVDEIVDEEFIVANTAQASTVAFIAPGPQNDQGLSETQVKVDVSKKLNVEKISSQGSLRWCHLHSHQPLQK